MSAAARDRLVAAALIFSESAWVYALLGGIGLVLGAGGSPLGWLIVLGLMAASGVAARAVSRLRVGGPGAAGAAVHAALGAAAVYAAVGTQVGGSDGAWNPGWPALIATASDVAGANFRATVGAAAGLALWWRGGRIGSSEDPAAALDRSYKIGTVIMTAAVLTDLGAETDLRTPGALFAFFAGTLAGLGVARLGRGAGGARGAAIWLRAVGAAVAAVLAIGFAFSLVRRGFLEAVSAPVAEVLRWMGAALFYVFIVPVAWVVNAVVRLYVSLFSSGEPRGDAIVLGDSIGEQFLERQGGASPAYVQALEWLLLALVSAVALYILYRAVRRRGRSRPRSPEGVRESVSEGADPAYDAAALLYDLLPAALRRRRGRRRIAVPEGSSGVARAVRCYYRLVLLARSMGVARPRSATPLEHRAALEGVAGADLARGATDAFNAAFYGAVAPPDSALREMDAELERIGAPELD